MPSRDRVEKENHSALRRPPETVSLFRSRTDRNTLEFCSTSCFLFTSSGCKLLHRTDVFISCYKVSLEASSILMKVSESANFVLKKRNEDNRARESTNDRRRRKFLSEREQSHRASLKRAAASDVVCQLLNPSQSEIFEAQYLCRIQLQRDLIAENRISRDKLISSLDDAEVSRLDIWRKEEVAREFDWIIKQRIAGQLEKLKVLRGTTHAADQERKSLFAEALMMRVRKITAWVDSCELLGLFSATVGSPSEIPCPIQDSTISINENIRGSAAAQGEWIEPATTSIFWNDAAVVFSSLLQVMSPLPDVSEIKIVDELPFSLSEVMSIANSVWLLSKPFRSEDFLAILDSQSLTLTAGSMKEEDFYSDSKSLESTGLKNVLTNDDNVGKDIPVNRTEYSTAGDKSLNSMIYRKLSIDKSTDSWGSNPKSEISEHLALHDLGRFMQIVGGANASGDYDKAPILLSPSAAEHAAATAPTIIPTSASKGRGAVTPVEVEGSPVDPALVVHAPSWILETPSKYLLGEIILSIRCTAEEESHSDNLIRVADGGLPVGGAVGSVSERGSNDRIDAIQEVEIINTTVIPCVPTFPIRLAVFGLSDMARRNIADTVCSLSEGRVRVIRVNDLLCEAIELSSRQDTPSSAQPNHIGLSDSDRAKVMDCLCEKQELAQRIQSILLSGATVPDDVYVSLVLQAVRDLQNEKNSESIEIEPETTTEHSQVQALQGYVLEDFPNDKQQASLLITALSGIDYDSRKPQVTDRASAFALPAPREIVTHDASLCGLDAILFMESENTPEIESSLDRILSARMIIGTNKIIYLLNGDISSTCEQRASSEPIVRIDNLVELNSSSSSRHTIALDLALTSSVAIELKGFLDKVGILKVLDPRAYVSSEEFVIAAAEMMYQPHAKASDARSESACRAMTETSSSKKIENHVDESITASPFPGTAQINCEATHEDITRSPSPSLSKSLPLPAMVTELPRDLAIALSRMWGEAERQSVDAGRSFFKALRNCRYQMVQRRRALHDALSVQLTRLDCRQELLDDFVTGFNQIDDDFRFDVDCIAELHLRSLELRDVILLSCGARRKECEAFVAKTCLDGISALLVHASECEGAVMLQAEYNRFVVSLHLLFDFTKAMASYDSTKKIVNTLEETLQAALPDDSSTSNTKSDGRKLFSSTYSAPPTSKKPTAALHRKGSAVFAAVEPEPHRAPIPAIALPLAAMVDVPKSTTLTEATEEDSKASTVKSTRVKSDAKSNRSRPESSASSREEKLLRSPQGTQVVGSGTGGGPGQTQGLNTFHQMESAVLELILPWSREVFRVSSALYDKDRGLCNALETAIWYECERLRVSITTLKATVEEHTVWITEAESSLQLSFHKKISERYDRECASAERLIGMIGERIESAKPIKHQWLLAPDVISVAKNALLISPEPPAVVPRIETHHDYKLNSRQLKMLEDWIESISLGVVLLDQDLLSLVDRAMSKIGPFGTKSVLSDSVLRHLTFPTLWRGAHNSKLDSSSASDINTIYFEEMRKLLFSEDKVIGVDEHVGTVYADVILSVLSGKPPGF